MRPGPAAGLWAVLALLAGGARAQVLPDAAGATVGQNIQPNAQQNTDPPGSLSGRVINAVTGGPVRGASVSLVNYQRGGNAQAATTDGGGTFTVASLPPGEYVVAVNHPGFQGILGLPSPNQLVTVASGQESSGLTMRLMPGGTLSGKVVDDGGEPVSGCPVYVLGPGQNGASAAYSFRGSASTNDKGEYKLDLLTADRYVVYARCQEWLPVERPLAVWRPELIEPRESWLPVFYPDSPSPEGAQWVTVLPGSELAGIDFHLRATSVTTVSGTIGGIPAGIQPNIQLIPADAALDAALGYGASFDLATSTFRFQMVPPGSYRLIVMTNPSPSQTDSISYASLFVSVGRARPAPLFVQMRLGITLTGRVEQPPSADTGNVVMLNSLQSPGRQTPKAAPLGYLHFMPLTPSAFANFRQVEVRHDGTFTVQGLTPGRYKVVPQIASQQPNSLESVQFGSTIANHGVIELVEGASGALTVRMGGSPVLVGASLADAPAGSHGNWTVFALPVDGSATAFGQFMTGTGKSGDSVRLQNTSTGKFAFVAVEMMMAGVVQIERLNQLLRERADAVEIVAGLDQTVNPKFFTNDEIEELAMAYLRGEAR